MTPGESVTLNGSSSMRFEPRKTIRAAAPKATEKIGYGVPAFYHHGPLVSFGASKNQCAFYVQSPAVMEAHAAELAGYDTAKGTIRFQADKPASGRAR